MFQQLISFYWKLTCFLEKPHCVSMSILSGYISRPGTSEVQEGLFRNTQSHAKCWWEHDSVSACKEDAVWISVVCECLFVCVYVAVHTFLFQVQSESRGGAERFRHTAASCGPHRPVTVYETGEVAFLPVCAYKPRLCCCAAETYRLGCRISRSKYWKARLLKFQMIVLKSVVINMPLRGGIQTLFYSFENDWFSFIIA